MTFKKNKCKIERAYSIFWKQYFFSEALNVFFSIKKYLKIYKCVFASHSFCCEMNNPTMLGQAK